MSTPSTNPSLSRHKGVLLGERYRISRHVSDGRMGEVYVGRDLETNGRCDGAC